MTKYGSFWPLFFFSALLIGLICLPGRAQNIPAGTPSDVQAIMQKMKAGQRPTPAEIQRLQEWAGQLNSHLNTSAAGGSQFGGAAKTEQQGIPCRVEVTGNYTAKSPGGSTETFQITLSAKAILYPDIKGTGDYNLSAMNPSVPVSSFRFEPYAPGGQLVKAGGGSGRRSRIPTPTRPARMSSTLPRLPLAERLLRLDRATPCMEIWGLSGGLSRGRPRLRPTMEPGTLR